MRILRGLGIAAIGVLNAVLVLFGCGVDRLPPLPNETPNPPPVVLIGGGVGAAGAGGGPSSVCECAAEIYAGPSGSSCDLCITAITSSGQACEAANLACANDPACLQIIQCLGTSCGGADAGGVQGCIDTCLLPFSQDSAHQKMGDLLACACAQCGSCTFASAVSCGVADAGGGG